MLGAVVLAELAAQLGRQIGRGLVGLRARAVEEQVVQADVLLPGDPVGEPRREPAAQALGPLVVARPRGHPGRRALEHGHVRGLLGHGRDQRHRGRARADHDHALARVVEPLGPELRVDDLAGKAADRGQVGLVRLVVVVVARGEVEEAREDFAAAFAVLDLDVPQRLAGAPVGGEDLAAEADVRRDAALAHDALEVSADRVAIGDRLVAVPRLEAEAERVHVAVGADAGVAEQVPCAADPLAPVEHGEAQRRAQHLEVRGHRDAGNPGTDDQHVEGFPPGHTLQIASRRAGCHASASGLGVVLREGRLSVRRHPARGGL